jgi:hypothetical protein
MKLIKFYLLFTLAIILGCSTSSDNSTNPQPPFGPDYILLSSDQTIVEVGETVTMNVVDDIPINNNDRGISSSWKYFYSH